MHKATSERRRPNAAVSPESEDEGLFKNTVAWVNVQLVPKSWQNGRGDVLISGIDENGKEIEVLFAGRRTVEAVPLLQALDKLQHEGDTDSGSDAAYARAHLKLPVRIKGAWRARLQPRGGGVQRSVAQLIASEWDQDSL